VIEKTGFVDQRKSAIESFLSSSLMYQQQNNAAPVALLIFYLVSPLDLPVSSNLLAMSSNSFGCSLRDSCPICVPESRLGASSLVRSLHFFLSSVVPSLSLCLGRAFSLFPRPLRCLP
jgi:hypothetical protein